VLAFRGERQFQIGDIDAGDQENESHRREQDQKGRAHAAVELIAQRLDECRLAVVDGVRVFLLESRQHDVQRAARLPGRHAWPQPRDDVEGVRAITAGRVELKECPEVGAFRESKTSWHHADHRVRLVVQANRAADDVGARPELARPEAMAEHDDFGPARNVLTAIEVAPHCGSDTQRAKEVGRDARPIQAIRRPRPDQVEPGAEQIVRGDSLEHCGAPIAPAQEFRDGNCLADALGVAARHLNERLG
jgi:hypothetical protein